MHKSYKMILELIASITPKSNAFVKIIVKVVLRWDAAGMHHTQVYVSIPIIFYPCQQNPVNKPGGNSSHVVVFKISILLFQMGNIF